MALDKLMWGGEVKKDFEIEIKGKMRKLGMRALTVEDTLAMELNVIDKEKPDTKAIVRDAIEMLSRAIFSIDGQTPDSPEETKEFLFKNIQAADVFKILDKFQSLETDVEKEIKN